MLLSSCGLGFAHGLQQFLHFFTLSLASSVATQLQRKSHHTTLPYNFHRLTRFLANLSARLSLWTFNNSSILFS